MIFTRLFSSSRKVGVHSLVYKRGGKRETCNEKDVFKYLHSEIAKQYLFLLKSTPTTQKRPTEPPKRNDGGEHGLQRCAIQ